MPEPARADQDLDDIAVDDCTFDNDDDDYDYDYDYDLNLTMPPTEDDVREHDRLTFEPPPRIVARFYRPSHARRKDSAASSRRNSISSAHSRCSSIQPLNRRAVAAATAADDDDDERGVKIAAQHLRRASFLEDRRARLADRAAHVEKVRLRAALAKAAPKGQTTSEERALAAQQARERNLAEIVSSCAEEVKKAKQVAEATKERREHDLAKMRAQLEERMAEAQKRREELRTKSGVRRRSRGQSILLKPNADYPSSSSSASAASDEMGEQDGDRNRDRDRIQRRAPKLTDEQAAARIQTWWRARARKNIISEFLALGLHVDSIRDTSFDDVVQLLARDNVLSVTSRLLRICGLREGKPGSVEAMAAVRTFLSAFLILGHPNQVLSNKDGAAEGNHSNDDDDGDSDESIADADADAGADADASTPASQEDDAAAAAAKAMASHRLPMTDLSNPQLQTLVGKAKDVLISFENCLASLTPDNRYTLPSSMKKILPGAYAVFHNAFIAWKARDSNALIEVMLLQFVELDAILETVSTTSDPAAASVYRQSIQDSQLMLLVRIKRLAGPEKGKKLIAQAVHEARKTRKSKKQAAGGDTKPRGVTDAAASSSSSSTTAAAAAADSSSGAAAAAASTTEGLTPSSADDRGPLLTPPATPAAGRTQGSKEQRGGLDKSGLNGLLPDNRTVVHELAINHEYEIPSEDYVEQQAIATTVLYATMRDALRADDGDTVFSMFLITAAYMKDKLQRLLNPGNSLHDMVRDSLDPELARRQFSLGNFSYEKFFSFIGVLLPKLCAPFRDDEVRDLVQNKLETGDLVDRLKAVHRFIDLMVCDYINYLLRLAAPQLIETSSQYEAKRFAEEMGGHGDADADADADGHHHHHHHYHQRRPQMKLDAALAAWRSAHGKVMAEVQKRDVEGINHPKSRPSGSRIYAQMLVDVFTQPTPIDPATVPEMLRLDEKRITEVSTMIQRIITAGAVLLQCKNLLKRDARSPWRAEAARIMAVLEAHHGSRDAPVAGVMAALEAGRSMPTATRGHLRALVTKVLTASQDMSLNASEPREPVLRLLLARLRSNILARLASGSATEKIKAASTAGEKLATLGLSEFVEKVRHIADLLDKVGSVDRGAHSPWWDVVAERMREDDAEA
ncbi:T-complex protein 11-like protein 2 [Escovopsis weberi]|uniref:T-complex protein 11-like protein 2 n=1 Tax=Escovopsis weberi TaxID=150374 RepID=A0A0M9VWR2_ESCWE|nr:T-complex protein 11-like protein 2 [Escovopsis weberi]